MTFPTRRLKYSVKLRNEKTDSGELTYLGLENIESFTGKYVKTEKYEPDGECLRFTQSSLLFNKLRPYLAKVFRPDSDGKCTGELLVLEPSLYIKDFLFYLLLNSDFIRDIDASTYGSKMPRANWEYIGNRYLSLPPPPIQKAIAAYLDKETARIDALIAKKERQIELLQEKRQAIITRAITKGIDPKAKMKDSGVEWIGDIPEGWEIWRLKHLTTFSFSNVDKHSYDDEDEVILCNYTDAYNNEYITSNIEFMKSTASRTEKEKFLLRHGQVIMTKDSESPDDIGVPAFVAEDIPNLVCGYHLAIVSSSYHCIGEYIFRSLQSNTSQAFYETRANGITRYAIGIDAVGDCPIAFPKNLTEQKSIVEYIKQSCNQVDRGIVLTKDSILLLREYRSSLITAAVSGQIDVSQEVAQ